MTEPLQANFETLCKIIFDDQAYMWAWTNSMIRMLQTGEAFSEKEMSEYMEEWLTTTQQRIALLVNNLKLEDM